MSPVLPYVDQRQAIGADGRLTSDLWFDRPDALELVARRRSAGELSEQRADQLGHFVENGYLVLDLDLPERICDEIQQAVDRLWRERRADVAYAYDGPLRPMDVADEQQERRPPYRISGLETVCPAALDLFLHPELFAVLRLLFEERAVATQSIYFEYGSRQPLHRDPVHVVMDPASHLLAAWIALEDIRPDSGPLTYVPGSHRHPYFQFEPGIYRYDHYHHTAEDARRMAAFELEQCERLGLKAEPFLPRRGQALIWHHSLLHGGSPGDHSVTRKSFVVHYTTMRHYQSSRFTLALPEPDGSRRLHVHESWKILARDGCYGYLSPMRGKRLD
ncbi:MAG TPA: phytanoyl-CoA dioxygenase family protein [Thermoanaerobaculia bacterium]|nr:phytanoyl-CoA dioxygenase family protein [Thermoanaerobaculia bacterium]